MINIEKDVINSKVVVIDSEGVVYAMGRVNEPRVHVKYLLDFLKEKYPSIDINKLTIGMSRGYYGYIFGILGDVIYFNDMNRNSNTGMVFVPNEMTDEQIGTMYNLNLGSQKIAICYGVKSDGNSRMIGGAGNYNLKEALDQYMMKINAENYYRR